MTALPAEFTTAPETDGSDPLAGLYQFDQVAPLVGSVGSAEIEAYRELGFLAVRDVYDSGTIRKTLDGLAVVATMPDQVIVEYEKWAKDRPEEFRGERLLDGLRKLMTFVDFDDRLLAAARHPAVLATARSLLGAEPVLFQDMALLKPPGGGREKPWHQDHAFFDLDVAEPIVGVWIALDDATAANGAMHVLPGSHREGPVPHFQRRDLQICDTWVHLDRDTVVPLPAGSALFFDGLMHHGTPPNRTGSRRRAIQFHYVRADARHISDREHVRMFGAESQGATC
jgi:ectoine hydroxylase-related dioxygenase (phytanoyl-CoA dioxygenase family)